MWKVIVFGAIFTKSGDVQKHCKNRYFSTYLEAKKANKSILRGYYLAK